MLATAGSLFLLITLTFLFGSALGYPSAMVELAILYRDGVGVRQDLPRAGELLERAAINEPSSPPVFSLLQLFEIDGDLKHHYRGARRLFEAEAAKGNARAMLAAFKLAETGRGVGLS